MLVKALDRLQINTGRKFLVLGLKVQPVDVTEQASRRLQLSFDECRVEDQLRPLVGDLRLPPQFNLALERLEVPLNPVHANLKGIQQVEALGMLGQHGRKHA